MRAYLLCTLLSLSICTPSLISYQSHSYNALPNLVQAIAKGSRWFKIDPHYMPSEFCVKYDPNLNNSNGCFLLNHDLPTVQNQYYNNTDQLLSLLVGLVDQGAFLSDNAYVAFCFKYDYGNPCNGNQFTDQRAKNWAALVDDLYERCNNITRALGEKLQWVMDGTGTSGGSERSCLVGRWPLWPATWIFGDDPIEALDSNDNTTGLDQFQINNMEEGNSSFPTTPLDLLRAHSPPFGKFLESSAPKFPFLLWEPDRQSEILALARNYLQGPLSPGGFRFAANIDPIQLSIYAARASTSSEYLPHLEIASDSFHEKSIKILPKNNGEKRMGRNNYNINDKDNDEDPLLWNYHLNPFKNATTTFPHTPYITSPSNQPDYFQPKHGRPLILLWQEENNRTIVQTCRLLSPLTCGSSQLLQTATAHRATTPTVKSSSKPLSNYFTSWRSVTTIQEGVAMDIVVGGTAEGEYEIFQLAKNESLVSVGSGTLPGNGSAFSLVTSPDLFNVSLLHLYGNSSETCALSLASFPLIWQNGRFSSATTVALSTAAPSRPSLSCGDGGVPRLRDISSCVVPRSLLPPKSFIMSSSLDATGVGCARQVMGLVAFEVTLPSSFSSSSLLFANLFVVDDPFLGSKAQFTMANSSQIGVGTNPSVSVGSTSQGPMGQHPALIVAGEGYCYNSHVHNTQAFPSVCQQLPVSIPNVLTYSFADLVTWFNFLSSSNNNFLTSCSLDFQHGMYDMGTFPSATLFTSDTDSVGVAALHQGISNLSTDVGGCGLAEAFNGLVLDGWLVR